MLADMMLFARPPKLAIQQVDLVSLIGELLAELNDVAAAQNTAMHGPLRREPLRVEVDSVQIRVALKALCMNAIESLGSGGNVTIELEATDIRESATVDDAEEAVRITVTDDGPGVPAVARAISCSIHFSAVAKRIVDWDLDCASAGGLLPHTEGRSNLRRTGVQGHRLSLRYQSAASNGLWLYRISRFPQTGAINRSTMRKILLGGAHAGYK